MFRKSLVVLGCCIGFVLVFLLWPSSLINISAAAPANEAVPTAHLVASGQSPIGLLDPNIVTSSDDRENATPTAWWVWSGQTVSDILNFATTNNARVVDLAIDSLGSPHRFTATYVVNTGAYAKTWYFYDGVDANTLGNCAERQQRPAHCAQSLRHRQWADSLYGGRHRQHGRG